MQTAQRSNATSKSHWPPEVKMRALSVYAETLNQNEAARQTGIPQSTINSWLNEEDSTDLIDKLRLALRHSMAWKCAEVARDGMLALHDRILNGEQVLDKEGNLIRVPMSAKDITHATSMATDKHALLTGGIKDSKGLNAGLLALAEQLKKMGESMPKGRDVTPSSGDAEPAE